MDLTIAVILETKGGWFYFCAETEWSQNHWESDVASQGAGVEPNEN